MEGALRKYGVHAVVGNLLQTRYDEVTLTTLEASGRKLAKPKGECIEQVVVSAVARLHEEYIGAV